MRDLTLTASAINDSRGRPTVRVTLRLKRIEAVGEVPAGASTGEDEAATVPVEQAIRNVHEVLLPLLRESKRDLGKHEDVVALDRLLAERAGPNFRDLGANAVLPVSRALWAAAARKAGLELHAYLRKSEPLAAGQGRVLFYMNIFNGGLHALKPGETLGRDRIDFQEIMVVPCAAKTYAEALTVGDRIDQALKAILVGEFGAARVTRADEAGFSVGGLGDNEAAFARVVAAVERAGFTPGREVKLALDVAASSFCAKGRYEVEGDSLTSEAMIEKLLALVERYPGMIISVEDGLAENDWKAWPRLSAALKKHEVLTIGDDLFVTQLPRLRRGIESEAAHGILIKVNQNGTMSGTLDVIKAARQAGLVCVVSHRSGETLDDSIADLAYATGAFGLKTGDPQPEIDFPDPATWVRRRKYLRMVAIEKGAKR
ncbi:MAG: phosphopyruvate hydratase [Deltaproteobacteria bacterium]|nr:phosphopyruvate hydratase [Deltaproteobacteria bacterium]